MLAHTKLHLLEWTTPHILIADDVCVLILTHAVLNLLHELLLAFSSLLLYLGQRDHLVSLRFWHVFKYV